MSILNKTSLIVLGGAVVGAILTAVALYFTLVIAGVDPELAKGKALIYGAIIGVSFLIPVYMIRLLIDKFIISKVKHMSEIIFNIARGDIDAKMDIKPDDEIGEMAKAVERMRWRLKLLVSKAENKG